MLACLMHFLFILPINNVLAEPIVAPNFITLIEKAAPLMLNERGLRYIASSVFYEPPDGIALKLTAKRLKTYGYKYYDVSNVSIALEKLALSEIVQNTETERPIGPKHGLYPTFDFTHQLTINCSCTVNFDFVLEYFYRNQSLVWNITGDIDVPNIALKLVIQWDWYAKHCFLMTEKDQIQIFLLTGARKRKDKKYDIVTHYTNEETMKPRLIPNDNRIMLMYTGDDKDSFNENSWNLRIVVDKKRVLDYKLWKIIQNVKCFLDPRQLPHSLDIILRKFDEKSTGIWE